jgi:hypothetical protein
VKSYVTDVNSSPEWHTERLNRPVKILVIQSIFVVPDPGARVRYFVTQQPKAIVTRVRLDLIYRCACPSLNGRLHSHGLANRGKCEVRYAANKELTVGSVVIHVALPRMGLTPRILKRIQVLRFHEIGCTCIECCVQIIDINANPVRYAVMCVAVVIGRSGRKRAGKRIDPRA